MIRLIKQKQYTIVIGLAITVLVLLTLGNFQIARHYPAGNDFLAHWQGTRSFILNGISPYSEEATREIFGTIDTTQPESEAENYRFLAPLFSLIIYAPYSIVKNPYIAIALWMTLMEGILIGTGITLLNMGSWKRHISITALLFIYLMLSYPSVLAILNGSLVIVSLALIIFSLKSICNENDESAGLMLGLSLIKPEAAGLLILFVLIWAVIRKRTKIIYWFLGTLILLIGFSVLLIPDWPLQYFKAIFNFSFNNPISSESGFILFAAGGLSSRFLIVKSVVILMILVLEWFFVRHYGIKRTIWLVSTTLSLALWLGASSPVESLLLALPGLFFGFEFFSERWKGRTDFVTAGIIIVLFTIQWLFSGFFFQKSDQSLDGIVKVIIPGVSIVMLYWSRWWVLHGKKLNEPDRYINL